VNDRCAGAQTLNAAGMTEVHAASQLAIDRKARTAVFATVMAVWDGIGQEEREFTVEVDWLTDRGLEPTAVITLVSDGLTLHTPSESAEITVEKTR